jgi:acetoin utilization protein AcuB
MSAFLTVKDYMTKTVVSIGQEQPLAKAKELMEKHQVRHLPVQHGGKLVGILSLRDLQMFERQEAGLKLSIYEAMTQDPEIVEPDTPLKEVADTMAHHKLSCVIVAVDHKVQGIFTYVDALKALSDRL